LQAFKYKLQSSAELHGLRKNTQFLSRPCKNKSPSICPDEAGISSPPSCGQQLRMLTHLICPHPSPSQY